MRIVSEDKQIHNALADIVAIDFTTGERIDEQLFQSHDTVEILQLFDFKLEHKLVSELHILRPTSAVSPARRA